MSDSPEQPWSDNPNAPKIPLRLHLSEKGNFTAAPICAVLYGIATIIFFQCMGALLDPARRKQEGIRWPFLAHTVAMFLLLTTFVVTVLCQETASYIDNRGFAGLGSLPPGPIGYWRSTTARAPTVISYLPPVLNGWLADGLLLYRCHIIHAMNSWIIAFPCLVYFASFVMGIMWIFQTSHPDGGFWQLTAPNLGLVYFSISLSLNILLTLMIVTRLILHNRMMIRNLVGARATVSGLRSVVITLLIESCALNAVGSLLYLVPWSIASYVSNYFYPVFSMTQVIAPFLVILRVANRTALTSEVITEGPSTICFKSRTEVTEDDGLGGNPTSSVGGLGDSPGESSVGAQNAIEEASSTRIPSHL